MNDYPLVVSHAQLLVAVDPLTGRRRWQVRLPKTATRLFRIGGRLLVGDTMMRAADARLRCFDLMTGALVGEVALGFGIDNGFVHGDHLYVAGGTGFACLTADGTVVWRALRQTPEGWFGTERPVICTDGSGNELWRCDDPGVPGIGDGQGLLLGDVVAQPDVRGSATQD